jgi:hypothetical protein
LLALVDFGELLVIERAEAAGEVPVGLEARVVPRGAGVGARCTRPASKHGGVPRNLVTLAVGGHGGGGGEPGGLVGVGVGGAWHGRTG